MEIELEKNLGIVYKYIGEEVFRGCLRRGDFMSSIECRTGGISIFIDTQNQLPETFKELELRTFHAYNNFLRLDVANKNYPI